MSKIFEQLKILISLFFILSVVGCTPMTPEQQSYNSYYPSPGPSPQFTNNMLGTPNMYTYYRPIQFGHVDVHANDVYSPVYSAPLAIYPHYQH